MNKGGEYTRQEIEGSLQVAAEGRQVDPSRLDPAKLERYLSQACQRCNSADKGPVIG